MRPFVPILPIRPATASPNSPNGAEIAKVFDEPLRIAQVIHKMGLSGPEPLGIKGLAHLGAGIISACTTPSFSP